MGMEAFVGMGLTGLILVSSVIELPVNIFIPVAGIRENVVQDFAYSLRVPSLENVLFACGGGGEVRI